MIVAPPRVVAETDALLGSCDEVIAQAKGEAVLLGELVRAQAARLAQVQRLGDSTSPPEQADR